VHTESESAALLRRIWRLLLRTTRLLRRGKAAFDRRCRDGDRGRSGEPLAGPGKRLTSDTRGRRLRNARHLPARVHGVRSARISCLCAALLAVGTSAHAGPADDCNQVRDLKRQLRGCTAYIRLGKGTPQNLATAYLNRANIYARRHTYARAFSDYAAAIARDPHDPLVFYNRGNAYFDLVQYERAIADYTRAIALDKRFALAYLNRGIARERSGDSQAAAADYRRVLTLDPAAAVARRRLQRLQSQ